MNKGIAMLLLAMTGLIVDTYVIDGGELDRIASASGARDVEVDERMGPDAAGSGTLVAVASAPEQAGGQDDGHSAGPWGFDAESEGERTAAQPQPVAGPGRTVVVAQPARTPQRQPRASGSTEIGALTPEQMNLEL